MNESIFLLMFCYRIEEHFNNSVAIWVFKASMSKSIRDAFAIFEKAIIECEEKSDIWAEFIRFVLRRANQTKQPKYLRKTLELMSRAGDNLPKDLILERVRLTRSTELAMFATAKFPDDLEAWTIRLLIECSSHKNTDRGRLSSLLK